MHLNITSQHILTQHYTSTHLDAGQTICFLPTFVCRYSLCITCQRILAQHYTSTHPDAGQTICFLTTFVCRYSLCIACQRILAQRYTSSHPDAGRQYASSLHSSAKMQMFWYFKCKRLPKYRRCCQNINSVCHHDTPLRLHFADDLKIPIQTSANSARICI